MNTNASPDTDTDPDTETDTKTDTHRRRHYEAPGWATRHVMNPIISGLVKLGLPLKGAGILSVRGRTTGEWRDTPVNPLTIDGDRFLVAPRGETQWVRNLRAAGSGRLRLGRRHEGPDSQR